MKLCPKLIYISVKMKGELTTRTFRSGLMYTEIKVNGEIVERSGPKKKFTGRLVWKYTERGTRVRYESIDANSFQHLILGMVQ